MKDQFQVVVIGGGPAGYVAAIRCAQLGLKTACIDRWVDAQGKPALGGTCLNVGCIPSKALLESSERFDELRQGLVDRGIKVTGVELDLDRMLAHKDRVVRELTQGIEQLLKANKVTWIPGTGQLQANRRVAVSDEGKETARVLSADHVILAPGSSAVELGSVPLQDDIVVDSTGALEFREVPRRLGIIGAGVIGLELGSVWRRLGAESVTLLEAQDSFLPFVDTQVAREALRLYTQQGLNVQLDSRVTGCELNDGVISITYKNGKHDQQVQFDKLIVAVGRRPNSNGLAADEATLLLDEWGFIHVDEQCRTNLPGVYAIGDAVRGPMLAHKGSEEGMMVAELIAGHAATMNYGLIPSVIYTLPEVAWVGETEQALKAAAIDYTTGVFPFAASGRARAMNDTNGFIKVLADATSDRILGVHMIGPHCSELIAEAVTAMHLGASSEDVALTVFAHPTLSEAFHEAALAAQGRAIHIAQRPRKN
ncbi:MAG: dihydrolipoyl dehydrogenase [Thiogranum sp.]|nr:dihydrolipoyl dehydrogenase [Thiogranum sp.]